MIIGGKPTAEVTQRCERPHDHRPHQPYVRPGSRVDYSCPGGPLDPTLFATGDELPQTPLSSRRRADAGRPSSSTRASETAAGQGTRP